MMKKCPVCENRLTDPLPAFCSQCAWDLKNDPLFIVSLNRMPQSYLDEWEQRKNIHTNLWQRCQNIEKRVSIERRQLEIRIFEMMGKVAEALKLKRQMEFDNIHETNHDLLQRIHDLEDEACVVAKAVEDVGVLKNFKMWQSFLQGISETEHYLRELGIATENVPEIVNWAATVSLEEFKKTIKTYGLSYEEARHLVDLLRVNLI